MSFPRYEEIAPLINLAKFEDMRDDDVTSRLLIPESQQGCATLVQKETGVICGLSIVPMICLAYDERIRIKPAETDFEGRFTANPVRLPILEMAGPLRSILSAERVILNFLQRLSGVATQTHHYVAAISGTSSRIYDTRKTTPGWRLLEKYAVRCGGGQNHRMGLYDGLLVKDNHIASIPLAKLAAELAAIVRRSRDEAPTRFIQIEVDTLDQLQEVLKVNHIDSILLDNMPCETMRTAVQMRDHARLKGQVALEASGGINLSNVRTIAETGVERISVGALTHSAVSLDLGLDVE